MHLHLAGIDLELLPDLAVFVPETRDLLVADLHLGKSATFRARGIPIPEGETAADLQRLTLLAERTHASRIIVAGDLVHAPEALRHDLPDTLAQWMEDCPATVLLVAGNHDQRAGLHRIPCPSVPELTLGPLLIRHHPESIRPDQPAIAGHWHPSIRLPDSPRRSSRLACFFLHHQCLILPGFGSFTGTHPITPTPGDRVFVPLGTKVREIPAALLPS
ncbi:ligase-associated DNA damage response endonuclease PdeM [Haloferula luteola]|nr:ligase-associated DNA damage response endonuclease PdeM [Haloferula luteola]